MKVAPFLHATRVLLGKEAALERHEHCFWEDPEFNTRN